MLNSASVSPSVKHAVHSVSVAFGQLTHQARMLPGFLIVGGQRCGTTSMYRALSQHPVVLKAVLHKGVHYFDEDYARGIGWYQAHFPLKAHARWAGRLADAAAVTFESSPFYMFHPLAAQRISRDLPGVKLLVLIRDPVERAYSAHAHELARGYETEPFERALELEPSRLTARPSAWWPIPPTSATATSTTPTVPAVSTSTSSYRLERLFGRDRIHVVDSSVFWADPEPSFKAVLDFLGLPGAGNIVFDRHNARSRAPMSETLRDELRAHFRPYDERLAQWLGEKPSWQT